MSNSSGSIEGELAAFSCDLRGLPELKTLILHLGEQVREPIGQILGIPNLMTHHSRIATKPSSQLENRELSDLRAPVITEHNELLSTGQGAIFNCAVGVTNVPSSATEPRAKRDDGVGAEAGHPKQVWRASKA